MPTATLQEIFHHVHIGKLVSEIRKPTHKLCNTYGLMPGDRNTVQVGGRITAWDIFNSTRKVAALRAPDAPAATKPANTVGHKQARLIRSYEQIPVPYDKIFRNRGLGSSLGSVDVMGERWIMKQIEYQVETFGNLREAMTAMMFSDNGFDVMINGDEVEIGPKSGSGAIEVDFGHPASHRDLVPKIIGGGNVFSGAWQTTTTNIHQELLDLVAHSEHSSRYPIREAWIDSTTAGYLLQNDSLKNVAGTANMVFPDGGVLNYDGSQNIQGKLSTHMNFTLRSFPAIRWNIYNDHVVLSDSTLHPFVKPEYCIFTPGANDGWLEYHEGSEAVVRDYTTAAVEQFGMDMWIRQVLDPAGFSMYAVDNGLPVPIVPTAWYNAHVHSV